MQTLTTLQRALPNREQLNDFAMGFPSKDSAVASRPLIHKRSISESSLALHPVPNLSDPSITLRTDDTPANDRTHCRSKSTPETTREGTVRETHAQHPQDYVSGSLLDFKPSSMRNISAQSLPNVPESVAASPAPVSTTPLRLRVDSAASGADNLQMQASPYSERRPSIASVSKVPTVMVQGTSFASVLPKSCSITCKAPLRIALPTSRMGLGGTMASSTPVTSPISQTEASRQEALYTPISAKSPQGIFVPRHRKNSLRSETQEGTVSSPPQTPAHLRNVGGSVRMANYLPNIRDIATEEEVHMTRKNSITIPRPLFSPFDFKRSMSAGLEERFGDSHDTMCSPKETV